MSAAIPIVMTREQSDICACTHPRILVEANAGAGKTTTAAMKIARLVEQGANPSRILALSYTEPGVQAYLAAFERLGLKPELARAIRVGTLEDFCAARLKWLENWVVERLNRAEQVRPAVLAAIASARESVSGRYAGEFALDGSGEFAVEGLLDEFAQIKGSMQLLRQEEGFRITPDSAGELGRDFTTLAVYQSYESQRCHFVDPAGEPRVKFRYAGDATYDLARLLASDDPSFSWERHPLRLRLDAVILDEMHDCNWAIFTVLQALLAVNDGVNFLGVGDRDQVIHARDGADAYFMGHGFSAFIGEPQRLPLTETRRFGAGIAQPLARLAHKSYPSHAALESRVEIRQAGSAAELIGWINDALTRRPGLRPDSPRSQLALLLRHPSAATELEHGLRRQAIRYQSVGFTSYLERPEVLFVRLLLAAAVRLTEQFRSTLLLPAKRAAWEFIGGVMLDADAAQTAQVVEQASQANFVEFVLPALLKQTPQQAVSQWVQQAMQLAASDRIEDLPRVIAALDIRQLARRVFVQVEAAEDSERSLQGLVRASQSYASISEFLRSLLAHDYDAHADKWAGERIILSSIEAAKGLEFEHVIIPDLNRSDFDGERADERNLFYVAASRARRQLTLVHRPGQASSYLRYFVSN